MKIGDIEKATGLNASTIRYWEKRGLIKSERSENKYRDIDEETIERLEKIKLYRELGAPIAEVKLWVDGIKTEKDILISCKRRFEESGIETERNKTICERMLAGEIVERSNFDFSESEKAYGDLTLGVDIGTTSISAQLATSGGEVVYTYCLEHGASGNADDGSFSSDAERLIKLASDLVSSAISAYPEIKAIGVTGQMHGIVCLDENGLALSPLYTWQNDFGMRKIDGESICDRIKRLCGRSAPSGYGIVTLYALSEFYGIPEGTAMIATIADALVIRLCGLKRCIMHSTNAASLGFYDVEKAEFDKERLDMLGIDSRLLPTVCDELCIAGKYCGVPVAVAVGDNQAGVFASLASDDDAVLNVGTSGQISFVCDSAVSVGDGEIRPYFFGKYLHVGATLCGGSAYATLASLISEILSGFGVNAKRSDVYEYLGKSCENAAGTLDVSTRFLGTREDGRVRGSIGGITMSNFNVSELAYGFLYGIAGELYELFLNMGGKALRIVASGNAMRRNKALRSISSEIFGSDIIVPSYTEEAALGAAICSALASGLIRVEDVKKFIRYEGEHQNDN